MRVITTSKTVRAAVNREVTNLRDPDDAKVIAVAIAAQAQAIITGDLDLLVLQSVQGIPILNPGQFLAWEKWPERQ